jgi:hypothetical protein
MSQGLEPQSLAAAGHDFLMFLGTATNNWCRKDNHRTSSQRFKRLHLFGLEISCSRWKNEFFITTNDIIKATVIRYQLEGKPLPEYRKFKEGIVTDLKQLKMDRDGKLAATQSDILRYLAANQIVTSLRRQKLFYWKSVPVLAF